MLWLNIFNLILSIFTKVLHFFLKWAKTEMWLGIAGQSCSWRNGEVTRLDNNYFLIILFFILNIKLGN